MPYSTPYAYGGHTVYAWRRIAERMYVRKYVVVVVVVVVVTGS
jgi:hypothetical protein